MQIADFACLVLTVGFFALSAVYAAACGKIR